MSDSFDRALRAAARRGRRAGVCPDATAMAAYADGRLAPNERRELEAHAADCPSCLRHLALLGSVSLDTPEPGSRMLQWLPHWRWLVPVASAVLVVAVWVGLPDEARRTQPAPRRDVADSAVSARIAREADGPTMQPPSMMQAPDVPSSPVAQRVDPSREATEFLQEARRRAAPPPRATPDGTAPGGETISVEPLTESVTVTQPPAAPAPSGAPTQAPAPPPALAGTDSLGASGRSRVAADSSANRTEAQLEKAGSEPQLLVDDEQGTRYRAVGGRIERSSDRGESWRAVFADTRIAFTAAACAPDASCWFGGTGGTMIRVHADEATRRVLPARARVDAIVVTPDHVEATVSTGGRFRTTDGGQTWTHVEGDRHP